jgi:hypothetical protein
MYLRCEAKYWSECLDSSDEWNRNAPTPSAQHPFQPTRRNRADFGSQIQPEPLLDLSVASGGRLNSSVGRLGQPGRHPVFDGAESVAIREHLLCQLVVPVPVVLA